MFVFGTAEDVFTMAVRIEENGNAFYTGAANITSDPGVKKLFEDLAGMEAGHIKAFKDLRSKLPDLSAGIVWDPEGLAESYLAATADSHIFTREVAAARLKEVKTPMDALDLAMKFELDSVNFFVGMKEILPDQKGRDEIDALIRSEMDHVRMLNAAKRQLAAGASAAIS